MPQISQYGGACGLTSLLMALKPEARGFAPLLNEVARRKKIVKPTTDKGKNWQQSLEVLLTEIPKKKPLQEIVREDYGDDFTDGMLPLLEYDIEETSKHHRTRDNAWLMDRVNVWKKNSELSMLASLFGCKIKPYTPTPDGTGSVSFNWKELPNIIEEKKKFLGDRVNYEDPVVCNTGGHWIAIKELDKDKIKYHNTGGYGVYTRDLSDFSEDQRFYAFKCSPEKWKRNQRIIRKALFPPKKR